MEPEEQTIKRQVSANKLDCGFCKEMKEIMWIGLQLDVDGNTREEKKVIPEEPVQILRTLRFLKEIITKGM